MLQQSISAKVEYEAGRVLVTIPTQLTLEDFFSSATTKEFAGFCERDGGVFVTFKDGSVYKMSVAQWKPIEKLVRNLQYYQLTGIKQEQEQDASL